MFNRAVYVTGGNMTVFYLKSGELSLAATAVHRFTLAAFFLQFLLYKSDISGFQLAAAIKLPYPNTK